MTPSRRIILSAGLSGLLVLGCKSKPPATSSGSVSSSPAAASAGKTPGAADNSPSAEGTNPADMQKALEAVAKLTGASEEAPEHKAPQQWKPFAGAPTSLVIPYVKGYTTDAAIVSPLGDVESINVVTEMDATTATVENTHARPPQKPSDPPNKEPVGPNKRAQALADLQSSGHIFTLMHINKTDTYPGTTGYSLSTASLNLLRDGKTAPLAFQTSATSGLDALMTGKMVKQPTLGSWDGSPTFDCELHRVEPGDLDIPVIVNDVPSDLPALHAQCSNDAGETEDLFVLDQPSNPLLLATQYGPTQDRMQVIKISFPAPGSAPNPIEKKLADKEAVQIYGIYFDVGSSQLKPQSEATLKMISDVLHKNPAWKLSLAGHTDNVGGDDANLTLSKNRSAAVKQALIAEYKIAPDRLSTDGFGATKPVAPNDTVQGRALNRRVELTRGN